MKRMAAVLIAAMMLGSCAMAETALVPKPMPRNDVAVNPYVAASENAIHNDIYSSDVTNLVAPLGIHSAVGTALEVTNVQAPPAAFYDSMGHAITPLLGGIAISELDGETIVNRGAFVPHQHDGKQYRFQISYAFVDAKDQVVAPTSDGRIVVIRTMDEEGQVLPVFRKVKDIDVVAEAVKQLGEEIDTRLLSIVYDYSGNLWFVTGGFRIVPERDPAGFIGYISSEYMHAEEELPLAEHIFFYPLSKGESAENGISANTQGAVILTNQACYTLSAEDGVAVQWRVAYGSVGAKDAQPGSAYTGGGLAWGSGTTPTLTEELVIFTDNLDPINLIALDARTGSIVAQTPVLDQLGDDIPVSVENSIIVYSAGDGNASVIVCNWFGAGNAGLADMGADSSVLTYANLYDANWMQQGNAYLAPGVERVDFVKTADGYEARKVWLRDDIRDTSMMKLSTATGYIYGYWQNIETGQWIYGVLDFHTGETALEVPVSADPGYNNMAVGLIVDPRGNALYCPTNAMVMVRWQDDLAYLPERPLAPSSVERTYLTAEDLTVDGLVPAGYLHTVTIDKLDVPTTLALRINDPSEPTDAYTLLARTADGSCVPVSGWTMLRDDAATDLGKIAELHIPVADGSPMDLSVVPGEVTLSVILMIEEAY